MLSGASMFLCDRMLFVIDRVIGSYVVIEVVMYFFRSRRDAIGTRHGAEYLIHLEHLHGNCVNRHVRVAQLAAAERKIFKAQA